MENTITYPVVLTQGAISELKKIMASQNISPQQALRLGVKSGGCSGFSYILGFDDVDGEKDDVFTIDGLQVAIRKQHLMYLQGIELDFQDGLQNRGFIFNNPNAEETCGCGTSFSA